MATHTQPSLLNARLLQEGDRQIVQSAKQKIGRAFAQGGELQVALDVHKRAIMGWLEKGGLTPREVANLLIVPITNATWPD
jgi:hypothetical protein